MRAVPVGTALRADVRGRRAHAEPLVREQIHDAERKRERIAGCGGSGGHQARCGSRSPTVHAAQRTRPWIASARRDRDRELMALPLELIAPVTDLFGHGPAPVRVRTCSSRRALSVEQLPAGRGVGPDPAAHLHDHCALVSECVSTCVPDGGRGTSVIAIQPSRSQGADRPAAQERAHARCSGRRLAEPPGLESRIGPGGEDRAGDSA